MPSETYVIKPSGHAVIEKDANALLDYGFDWTLYLNALNDTIVSATFVVDPSFVVQNSSFGSYTATVWLSGGVAPDLPVLNELRVTCRIVTAGGRIDDRSIYIKIKDK